MNAELKDKWQQEFKAKYGPYPLRALLSVRDDWEQRRDIYLAACYARHAEIEELREENARLVNLNSKLDRNIEGCMKKNIEHITAKANAELKCIRLESKNARLRKALEILVNKLKLVHEDPDYKSVWVIAQMRQGPYVGATYTHELNAAQVVLSGGEAYELT